MSIFNSRLLESLDIFVSEFDFSDIIQNDTSVRTTFTFTSFAIQMHQVDLNNFKDHTAIVDLGPVETAKNISSHTKRNASLIFNNFASQEPTKDEIESSTASIHLQSSFFQDYFSSRKDSLNDSFKIANHHLAYTVFLTDVLFPLANNSSMRVGSIIVHLGVSSQLENATNITVAVQTSFDVVDVTEAVSIVIAYISVLFIPCICAQQG